MDRGRPTRDNPRVPSPESVRRRQSGVLVVGLVEPEVTPWLRAAGHVPRAVRDAATALSLLEEEPADLVIVDREPAGMDAAGVCRTLREGVQLSEPWLLAITVPAKGRGADSALDAGADDYLHRPFTRGELLARARAGVRAAQQRADDMLVRALLVNVPGAIYRSAWHAGHSLEQARHAVTVDGKLVHLTPIECKLLAILARHAGKVLTHRQLLREVWGPRSTQTHYLRVHMAALRRKIEADPARPRWLTTEPGVGYRMRDEP